MWGDSLTVNVDSAVDAQTSYKIYNGGVGGEDSAEIKTRFLAASPERRREKVLIWVGTNGVYASVVADVAAMVAALDHDNYLIFPPMNGDYASHRIGGADHDTIVGIGTSLAAVYGDKYFDIRGYLVSLYDPGVPQDVIDFADDIVPSSLRVDNIHLTAAANNLVAAKICTLLGLD